VHGAGTKRPGNHHDEGCAPHQWAVSQNGRYSVGGQGRCLRRAVDRGLSAKISSNNTWPMFQSFFNGMCQEVNCGSSTPRAATIITPKNSSMLASRIPTRSGIALALRESPGSCSMSFRERESSGLPGAAQVPSAHIHITNTRVPLPSLPLRGSPLEAHADRIAGTNSQKSKLNSGCI
jgi:hypothetical protein